VIAEVIAALRDVVGAPPAALHEPEFAGREWEYVKECLDTGWVSTAGAYVGRFEDRLREITGAKHAVAVMNGTAALHLAMVAAGVRAGDEVIVPDMTFVATANAVAHCGAVPHFAEIELQSLGLDVPALRAHLQGETERGAQGLLNKRSGRRIAAVVPMHAFGHAVDLDPLAELCREYGLVLVEDAAEAIGGLYKGGHVGRHGLMGVLSFNGNKVVTTGGGGAIITDDEALGRRLKHLSTTARIQQGWGHFHDEVGYNYRMPNLNAALGCAQLEQLEGFLRDKRALARRYGEVFERVSAGSIQLEQSHVRSTYWLNSFLLHPQYAGLRDDLLSAINAAGYEARPAWVLMHRLPAFRDCPRMPLAVAEQVESRLINLPSSARLGRRHAS
jgi:perosamine synthetase